LIFFFFSSSVKGGGGLYDGFVSLRILGTLIPDALLGYSISTLNPKKSGDSR